MKTVDEIYADMLELFQNQTGFSMENTADLAVRLYATAAEIHSLYIYSDWVKCQSFPQTAQGEYLDYHARLRGLTRRAPAKAQGYIRFYVNTIRESDVKIEAGTVCTTGGLVRFETTQAGTLDAGEVWVDIPAAATASGTAGNAAGKTILYMAVAPMGIAGCTNPAAFTGGSEAESDQELRERVLDSYVRLPNGANAAFYENKALEHEGVGAAHVIPRINGVGSVGIVVASSSGMPEAGLVEAIQKELEEIREIAVDVVVMEPEEKPVDVSVLIRAKDNYEDTAQAVSDAITGYFNGKRLAAPLFLAGLAKVIYSVDGVENYKIISPEADIAVTERELPRLKSLRVAQMEG